MALTLIPSYGVDAGPIAPKAGSIGDQTRANLARRCGAVIVGICLVFLFPYDPGRSVRHVEAMAFAILAFSFGLLFYAASSGLFAMTWEGRVVGTRKRTFGSNKETMMKMDRTLAEPP